MSRPNINKSFKNGTVHPYYSYIINPNTALLGYALKHIPILFRVTLEEIMQLINSRKYLKYSH